MLLKQNELNKTGGILVFQSSETKATTTAIAVAIATSTAIAIAIAVAIATATAIVTALAIAIATATAIVIALAIATTTAIVIAVEIATATAIVIAVAVAIATATVIVIVIAVAIAIAVATAIMISVAIATATAIVIATATAAAIIIKFSHGILLTNMLIYLETVQFRICTVRDNSTLKTSAVEMKNHLWAGMAVTAPTRGGAIYTTNLLIPCHISTHSLTVKDYFHCLATSTATSFETKELFMQNKENE